MMQRDWNAILLRLVVILVMLLVVLASCALLYIVFTILHKFGSVVLLFALGAIVAYVLTPIVNRLAAVIHSKAAAIFAVYLLLIAGLVILLALLVEPLVNQSSGLVDAFNSPSSSSLQAIRRIETDAKTVRAELQDQESFLSTGFTVSSNAVRQTQTAIHTLQDEVNDTAKGIVLQPPHTGKNTTAPPPKPTRIPTSYLVPIQTPVNQLVKDYSAAAAGSNPVNKTLLSRATSDAGRAVTEITNLRQSVSSTPLLVLEAQTWLDDHGIKINLEAHAGQVTSQLSDEATSLLKNTSTILSKTATLLVNTFLLLIISIYFISDGPRIIRRGIALVPAQHRDSAAFFVSSLDQVMGGYIRAQLALALLAGVLGGVGAAVLGVPYAVLIGCSTAILELVPVIGPVILIVPPVIVSLVFTNSVSKTVILLIWFVIFQQVVTNIIGPRVQSKSVGIHPLEAMGAALVGFPIAGFLGSFLAVPTVGLLHIVTRELYHSAHLSDWTGQPPPEPEPQPPPSAATAAAGPGAESQASPATATIVSIAGTKRTPDPADP